MADRGGYGGARPKDPNRRIPTSRRVSDSDDETPSRRLPSRPQIISRPYPARPPWQFPSRSDTEDETTTRRTPERPQMISRPSAVGPSRQFSSRSDSEDEASTRRSFGSHRMSSRQSAVQPSRDALLQLQFHIQRPANEAVGPVGMGQR